MITVQTTGTQTTVTSPYHPDMPDQAATLGGKWDGTQWTFDSRHEARVRAMLREVYGTDGTAVPTVTVRFRLGWNEASEQTVFFAGRQVATRPGRDSRVRLGAGVVIAEGSLNFPSFGGSMRNPRLDGMNVVLEISDVPAGHADIAGFAGQVEIVETETAAPDAVAVDTLLAEREQLLARLAEIDALLPTPEGTEATAAEAAQILGVSIRTVQRWAATGKVDARKGDDGRWVVTVTITV